MREYIVTYKQKYEEFTRTKKYQADFMNEALQRFLDEKIWVTDNIEIHEYETPYEIVLKWSDEPETCHFHFDNFEELMDEACHIEAFSDCAPPADIFEVWAEGELIEYCGWRPGMRYTWVCGDEVVWDCRYAHWDH